MHQHRLVRLVHSLLLTGACAAMAHPAFAQTLLDTTAANAGGQVPSATAPVRSACVLDRSPAADNSAESNFNLNSDLQGIYDEVSQLESSVVGDTHRYASVFFAPDWTFIDLAGTRQSWSEKRARDLSERLAAPWESRTQRIRSLTRLPDGAATVVHETTRRTIVDTEGRFGLKGVCRTVKEEVVYSDRWVRVADTWKLASREQTRPAKVVRDKAW